MYCTFTERYYGNRHLASKAVEMAPITEAKKFTYNLNMGGKHSIISINITELLERIFKPQIWMTLFFGVCVL